MNNTIIYLLGFPGTGKYTIAKEICAQNETFKLVDNHLINNPVFTVIRRDGVTPYLDKIWNKTKDIRNIVFETMVELSPPEFSFVLTNVLRENEAIDIDIYNSVENMAESRKAHFVPIRLLCELEENMRRIVMPDRNLRMKELKPKAARRLRAEKGLIAINHPNAMELDVTKLSATDTARTILDHARNLAPEDSA